MILDKEVRIKNNGRIINHYRSMGLDVNSEFIIVPIDLVTNGSHIEVSCCCDTCGLMSRMMFKTYKAHTKYDGLYYCVSCSLIKKKKVINEKYGVDSYTQTQDFKNKSKISCLEKYGTEFYQSSIKYKEQIKNTCLDRYGCENVMQSSKIFNNQQSISYISYKYKDTELTYQGSYELDFLEKYYNEIKIAKINPVKYIFNEKEHYYHPDFYLPDYNLIVEIKSSYTYNYDVNRNLLKKDECLRKGYNFIFIIDKNYIEFNDIIKILETLS
jgi:hypothetical protein